MQQQTSVRQWEHVPEQNTSSPNGREQKQFFDNKKEGAITRATRIVHHHIHALHLEAVIPPGEYGPRPVTALSTNNRASHAKFPLSVVLP